MITQTSSAIDQDKRRALISQIKLVRKPRQCEHLKTNGEFCGSPALRGRSYCYFHLTHIGHRIRAERAQARAMAKGSASNLVPLELPPFEDANSIQLALMQVTDAILHNRLDSKRAGLVLYALQTASANLANGADFGLSTGATVAGRYDDFEQDFEVGEDAPELRLDEAAGQEEESAEHAAKIAEIEELAAAYAKLDAAEHEAEANRPANAEENRDEGPGFHCDQANQFLCSLFGPRSQAASGDRAQATTHERDAVSQRLELVPRTYEEGLAEKQAAAA